MTRSGRWPGWTGYPSCAPCDPGWPSSPRPVAGRALQTDLATAMINAEAPLLGLYFVDDHFVPYEGAKPVARLITKAGMPK